MQNNDDNHADQNIERLLSHGYRPETPDPAFVKRVEDRLLDEARTRSAAPADATGQDHVIRGRFAGLLAAAAMITAVVWLGNHASDRIAAPPRDIDHITASGEEVTLELGRSSEFNEPTDFARVETGTPSLTARARGDAPPPLRVKVGDRIETFANQRRRVVLPDGSLLFVNAGSDVEVAGDRRVVVSAGEVYVEVERDPSNPFRVETEDRAFTALGTRFAVRADGSTPLVVTHGRVGVEGIKRAVRTGEQLVERDGDTIVEDAPRTSHVLDWTRDLIAAAESPLVPESDFSGGALIAIDPWGQEARLSLRKYHVDVHIEDGFARTTIDQTYFNHANWRMEGTFYFPLPADASLSRLAMYVGRQRMEGGMAERNHARDVYEQIVTRRRDPALLEWVDGSTFKMRVFPLEAREEKRLVLSYTQRLPTLYGSSSYRFPAGHNLGLVGQWSFNARMVGAAGVPWSSGAHDLDAQKDGNDLVLGAAAKSILLEDDVVLRFRAGPSRVAEPRFSTITHDGGKYLMVRYRPDLPSRPERTSRDWVFLFESSGSRDPVVARAQIDVVRKMLESAEDGDRFAIVTAATRTRSLSDAFADVTDANVESAMSFLERTHLVGAFDLGRALEAVAPFVAASDAPYVVHVGSGVSTIGERDIPRLVESVPSDAKYVGIAVGRQWSRPFMKGAAARTGGYFTQINPDESVSWRTFDLLATLDTPRLHDVSVVDDAESAQFLIYDDATAHGEEVVAITRVDAKGELPTSITVAGLLEDDTVTRTLDVSNVVEGAGYLPRQWARLEIDRLLADPTAETQKRVVELSMKSYVMSPYTSLLVLESEEMYKQFNVDLGRSDHWAQYPAPDEIDIVREPLDGSHSTPRPSTDAPSQVDVDAILQSILVRVPPRLVYSQDEQYMPGWNYQGQTTSVWQIMNDPYRGGYGYGAYSWGMEGLGGPSTVGGDTGGGGGGPASLSDRLDSFRDTRSQSRWNWFGWGGGRGFGGAGSGSFDLLAAETTTASFERAASGPMRFADATIMGVADQAFRRDFDGDARGSLSFRGGFRGGIGGAKSRSSVRTRAAETMMDAEFSGPFVTNGISGLGKSVEHAFRGHYRGPVGQVPPDSREPSDPPPPGDETRRRSSEWRQLSSNVDMLVQRIWYGASYQHLMHQRPYVNNNIQAFSDLLSFAPGMNTWTADIRAIMEDEAGVPVTAGAIDDAAMQLIERARSEGWRKTSIPGNRWRDAYDVLFDGSGRCRIERRTQSGLDEMVVNDGERLLHLYEELGVGSVRSVTRHHDVLGGLAPWLVNPVEDLAIGADVRRVDELTVEIVPLSESPYVMHLVFDENGPLVERRLVRSKNGDVLQRERYERDGDRMRIEYHDGNTSIAGEWFDAPTVAPPSLDVDTSELLVLPMPIRTYQHVLSGVPSEQQNKPSEWDEDTGLRALASTLTNNWSMMMRLLRERHLDQGDRRLGLYTLLASSGWRWTVTDEQNVHGAKYLLDPRKTHPDHPLAHYIAAQVTRDYNTDLELPAKMQKGFVGELAEMATKMSYWTSGRIYQNGNNSQERLEKSRRELLDFAERARSPHLSWAAVLLFNNYGGVTTEIAHDVAALCEDLAVVLPRRRLLEYERATFLNQSGDESLRKEAVEIYVRLFDEALDTGALPRFDGSMWQAVQQVDAQRWNDIVDRTIERCIEIDRYDLLPYFAMQLRWVGDTHSAEIVADRARNDVPRDQRLGTTLGLVEFHWHAGQHRRADEVVTELLEDEELATVPALWRLGAQLADQQGATARAVLRQERAVDLEFEYLPEVVDLNAVRQQYGSLLTRFQQLSMAVEALGGTVPDTVVSRVVRAADRWRAIDNDVSQPCFQAARILRILGHDDLAWDYLTTPLGARPNEGAPWQQVAAQLASEGELDLADRCYDTAFEIEPTNGQFLWEQGEMWRNSGELTRARKAYQKLVDGEWQPRFQWMQQQAKQYVER